MPGNIAPSPFDRSAGDPELSTGGNPPVGDAPAEPALAIQGGISPGSAEADKEPAPAKLAAPKPAAKAKEPDVPAAEPSKSSAELDEILAAHAQTRQELAGLKTQMQGMVSPAELKKAAENDLSGVLRVLGVAEDDPRLFGAGDAGVGSTEEAKALADVQRTLAEVTKVRDEIKTLAAEHRASAREQEVAAEKAALATQIDASGKYPLLSDSKAHEQVVDEMVSHYQRTGQPLPWDKAASTVEARIRENFVTRANSPAFKALLSSGKAPAVTPASTAVNNDLSGDAPAVSDDSDGPMDRDERLAWTIRQAQRAEAS